MTTADDPRPADRVVYLHVGMQKTGTSFLQEALWANRGSLARHGVLYPGSAPSSQRLAAWDIMGRRPRGARHPAIAGSWDRLVRTIADSELRRAIVSEEILVHARPKHVRRIVGDLAPAQVHVVLTVRDPGRVLVSAWQQELAKGHSWSWAEFAASVRDPQTGPATAGVAFWLRYDVLRVLDAWERAVPRERVHIVTAPATGSGPRVLLDRFAEATQTDPAGLPELPVEVNVAVGAAGAVVLRRLNEGLDSRLNERQYIRVVQGAVLRGLRTEGRTTARPIRLPAEEFAWVRGLGEVLVKGIAERGYLVHGELEDLQPRPTPAGTPHPDDVDEAEVAHASLAALVSVTEDFGRFWWRARRRDRETEAAGRARLSSLVRATGFRAKVVALRLADRSRLANRAAQFYLRKSSSRR